MSDMYAAISVLATLILLFLIICFAAESIHANFEASQCIQNSKTAEIAQLCKETIR